MARDVLLGGLVVAIIFLLGVEVLAETKADYSIESPENEFVIVVKPLPTSELKLVQENSAAEIQARSEEGEFNIEIHPVAENR